MNMIMLGAFSAGTKIITIDSLMNGLNEVVKAKNPRQTELNRKGLEMGARYVLEGAEECLSKK
jgi:Pyruvate/2-oxoacid:ferredoxin oxidoreductase gamma subunit